MKEHKVATRRGDMEKSAIAKCAWNHHHQVDWDKIKVLDKVANIITLLIKKPSMAHLPQGLVYIDEQRQRHHNLKLLDNNLDPCPNL